MDRANALGHPPTLNLDMPNDIASDGMVRAGPKSISRQKISPALSTIRTKDVAIIDYQPGDPKEKSSKMLRRWCSEVRHLLASRK